MPIAYRRANIHKRIFDICKMAKSGSISSMMAFRKCCMMAGDDVASRKATLFITIAHHDLHHALAESWGMKADPKVSAGKPLSDDVLCTGAHDYFHVSRLYHTKIMEDDQARDFIDMLSNVKTLYMNIRYINDPSRCVEDPGMMSFLPAGTSRAFHIFPYAANRVDPGLVADMIATVAGKAIYDYGRSRMMGALSKFRGIYSSISVSRATR
jgi:hypothetical protein